MANGFDVGVFIKDTSGTANATQSITGVGFTPKALILMCVADGAEGIGANAALGVGFSSAASVSRSRVGWMQDAVSTTAGNATDTAKALSIMASSSVSAECDLVSFDSDGFTLKWTTNNTSGYKIMYMAFGGSDITNVNVKNYATTAGTGNKGYTGVGFQPTIMFFLSQSQQPGTSEISFGVALSTSKRWFSLARLSLIGITMASGMKCISYQRTDSCHASTTNAGAEDVRFDFVSFDSDGFTVNQIANAIGTNNGFNVLCIKGGSWDVGSFVKISGTGSQSVSSMAFAPDGFCLVTGADAAASTSLGSQANLNIGGSDGTNQGSCSESMNNVIATVAKHAIFSTRCLTVLSIAGSVTQYATETSLDSGGFTINWGNGTTTTPTILWFAAKLTAGTPVSQTAVLSYEALGRIATVEISNIEAAGTSKASAISNFEALTTVKQTEISVFEALTRAARAGVSNEEALGRIVQTAIKNIEARGTVTTNAIHSFEALTRSAQSAVENWEATKSLASSRLSNWEALTRQATAAISNFEAQGLTAVSAVELSNFEALTRSAQTAVQVFEALGRIARAAVENWETQSSLASIRIALFESGIGIKNAAISNLEALGLVKLTATSYFEALTSVLKAAGQVFEALGRIARAAISAFEAQGNIPIISAAISNLEALGLVKLAAVNYFEALTALSKTAVAGFEALTRLFRTAISPFESQGFTLVSAAELSNTEALGAIKQQATSYFAAVAALLRTAGSQFEALGQTSRLAINAFEAAGRISQTELSSIESSTRAIRSATLVFEVLAGQISTTARPTFEALTRAAGAAIANIEATGQYLPLHQIASSSFEALHSIARNSGQMNIEWVRLAYGLILTQVLFAQLLTTQQGFAESIEIEKEFASTLELVARFLIHE